MGATQLGLTAFAPQFLGRNAADPVAINLYRAAAGARYATSQGDLREAAGKLAEAIKAVGVSQCPRFVADAVERARDPATVAAVEKSKQPPDLKRDAIRPVYPVEAVVGVVAASIVGGPAAAARALIGAGVKQALPDVQLPSSSNAGTTAIIENPLGKLSSKTNCKVCLCRRRLTSC